MFEIVMGIDDFLIQLVKYWVKTKHKSKNIGFCTLDGAKCINPIVKLLFKHVPMSIRSSQTPNQFFKVLTSLAIQKLSIPVLHQLDQKIIYPHYDFKHLTEKYFEIGMKLDDFLIQLMKY